MVNINKACITWMESNDETGLTLQQLAEDKYAKIMKDVEDVSNLIQPIDEAGHYQLFVEKNEVKVFVYCHSAYASFSSVKLSNVFKTIRLRVSESFSFKSCDKNDQYHLHLLSYFYSNVGLLGQLNMIKSNTVNEEMIEKNRHGLCQPLNSHGKKEAGELYWK